VGVERLGPRPIGIWNQTERGRGAAGRPARSWGDRRWGEGSRAEWARVARRCGPSDVLGSAVL